jgi:hypothetical protein
VTVQHDFQDLTTTSLITLTTMIAMVVAGILVIDKMAINREGVIEWIMKRIIVEDDD